GHALRRTRLTPLLQRSDDVGADEAVHVLLAESLGKRSTGHIGRLCDAPGPAGLDLIAQWRALAVADGGDVARGSAAAGIDGDDLRGWGRTGRAHVRHT